MSADDVYNQMISVADEIGCKFEKDPNTAGVYKITADNRIKRNTDHWYVRRDGKKQVCQMRRELFKIQMTKVTNLWQAEPMQR